MQPKKLLFVLATFFIQLLSSNDMQAQWGYSGFHSHRYGYAGIDPIAMARKKPFQRYGVGLSYIPVSGTFSYQPVDEEGNTDTATSVNINGWGAGVAYSIIIPCARTGEKTLLAVHIGLNGNFYMFKVPDMTVKTTSAYATSTSSYSGPGSGFMFGLPVGLDLLTGGEATLDRSDRFSFVLGAGFFPLISMANVHETFGFKARIPPYIKAEMGFHAGINWKVRATYITKSPISYTNTPESLFNGEYNMNARLNANDRFMITLLVQPFSFGWD